MTSGSVAAEAVSLPASSAAQPGRLSRIATFPAAISALLILLAVLTVRDRFDDPDMWWHLRTGQIIATTHHIPQTDIFSYTTNHHAYIPHEWLAQVLIYAAYAAHGLSGLMCFECAVTAAILVFGFFLCKLLSGTIRTGFLGAMIIWLFGTSGFAVRPQDVGYLLLIFELTLLHLGRTRNVRWFLLLPPLFAVWVNCHASFFLGFAVAAAYFVASFFAFDRGMLSAVPWTPAARRTLGAAVAVSALALLLNPTGIRLILYPLNTQLSQKITTAVVSEWQPLAFNQGRAYALLAVLAAILIGPGVARVRLHLHEAITLAIATFLALNHIRLVFPFGIIAAPILARLCAETWRNETIEQQHPIANATIIAAALTISYAAFPSTALLESQVRKCSPVGAVAYIRSHHLAGPMMNEWNDGGYLIWALPEHPVFIDGRADVYDWAGTTAEFARWATLAEPPNLLLDRYHVQFCLVDRNSPMNTAVSLLPNWQRVYSDDLSVIFVRTSPAGT